LEAALSRKNKSQKIKMDCRLRGNDDDRESSFLLMDVKEKTKPARAESREMR